MKHGVTRQEVLAFFDIRNNKGIERLDGLEKYFYAATTPTPTLVTVIM